MYFLTMISDIEQAYAVRCFGFFEDLTTPQEILFGNLTDVREGCYDYAVIEDMDPGLYPFSHSVLWYKYDKYKDGYYAIPTPKEFENVYNFGIG